MAITITLTADAEASTGIDFEAYVASYFSDFQFSGWPYILGGDGPYAGDEIVILDKLEKKPATTKVVVLDGEDFFYYFTGHTVSGSLASVRLATLGDSYEKDGSFDQNKSGHIKDISTSVEITGLSISNAEGVKGDFHNLVADLMATDAGHADASILIAALANDAQILNGSGKADTYTGTKFADVIRGNAGSDTLGGAGGNDNIDGGSGDDTAVFRGALADYTVTANGDGSVTIADKRSWRARRNRHAPPCRACADSATGASICPRPPIRRSRVRRRRTSSRAQPTTTQCSASPARIRSTAAAATIRLRAAAGRTSSRAGRAPIRSSSAHWRTAPRSRPVRI